jgi:dimethylhistidine N-methyltransferase
MGEEADIGPHAPETPVTASDHALNSSVDEISRYPSPQLGDFLATRAATLNLTTPLTAEDQVVQSMPDASPVKWHQAHTTWFFENFILCVFDPNYKVFNPSFGYLFNSYYESVGPRRPRVQRGLLTRPSLTDIRAYRRHVDEATVQLLSGPSGGRAEVAALMALGLAHEEQHQELILMDVMNLFAQLPGAPAYRPAPAYAAAQAGTMGFVSFEGGVTAIGHEGDGFAFDNEGPRHEALLAPFGLADRLVTNAEWLEFIDAGGYERPEYWLSDGWTQLAAEGRRHPLYWRVDDNGGWREMTLGGERSLDPGAPVSHVTYYEADAFARWAGKRLPSEAEWEHAACTGPLAGGLVDPARLSPAGAEQAEGLRQMFGVLWQWTRSPYAAYPGFEPAQGALGEYNGKFMINQMVLRGGCFATPPGHVRATYRNFFYPHQSWQFCGVRLAQDGPVRRRVSAAPETDFRRDVVDGLSASPKRLASKYFYDDSGSRLFEAICELEEYYPTRSEIALLSKVADDIARHISPGAALIEFGSGASVKTRLILDAAPQTAVYVPVDISEAALTRAAAAIRSSFPNLEVAPLVGDFTRPIQLPAAARGRPHTGFFPGSTIGNFPAEEAVAFLAAARAILGPGAQFIVGADLVKDPAVLIAAYDDAQGVTAAFNLNLLARINRELDGRLDLASFEHRAVWNAGESRIEMHLVSRINQTLVVGARRFLIARGESIHTENSHKYTPEGFAELARCAGWRIGATWISPEPEFAVFLLLDGA